ncbi:hypothetical protein BT69DRAFT_1237362 [Atractiella rhizophila]|nr:hypothetical protein BT69DRAFT_1237362 [Atractiella rhizophila]
MIFALELLLFFYHARADSVSIGSESYESGGMGLNPTQTFYTSSKGPPQFNILTEAADATYKAPILMSYMGGNTPHPLALVMRENGSMIWASEESILAPFNVQTQMFNGQQVLTFWNGTVSTVGYGNGLNYILDQNYNILHEVGMLNGTSYASADFHEFRITSDNTVIPISWRVTQLDLSSVGGPTDGWTWDCVFQEVDLTRNQSIFEWRSLEHINISESYFSLNGGGTSQDNRPRRVDKDSNGDYLISMRGPSAIYKVSHTDGSVLWRLNGKQSDFQMGNGSTFYFQHDARWMDNGQMSLFDNAIGGGDPDEPTARGIILDVDETAMTATLVQEYIPPYNNVSESQGSMQVLPNGNVFIGWGARPYFTEFASNGTVLYHVHFASLEAPTNNPASYRTFKSLTNWTATPTTFPNATYNTSAFTFYVSWLGATDISEWEAWGGNSTDGSDFATFASSPSGGFETSFPYGQLPQNWAMRAVAANGTCLGGSNVTSANGSVSTNNFSCNRDGSSGSADGDGGSPASMLRTSWTGLAMALGLAFSSM